MEEQEEQNNSRRKGPLRFFQYYRASVKNTTRKKIFKKEGVRYKPYKKGEKHKAIPKADFLELRKILNDEIGNMLLDGEVFRLPFNLGAFFIRKKKPRITVNGIQAPLSFHKTNNFGKKIFVTSLDYDGHYFALKWYRPRKGNNYPYFFRFKLSVPMSNRLMEKLKSERNYYKRFRSEKIS